MSTPGNTAKPRDIHSNIQTAQRSPSLVCERTYNALVSTLTHYASQAIKTSFVYVPDPSVLDIRKITSNTYDFKTKYFSKKKNVCHIWILRIKLHRKHIIKSKLT